MAYTAGTVHVKWLLPDGTPPPNPDPTSRDAARRRGSTVTVALSAAADDPQAVLKDPTDNAPVFSGTVTKPLLAAETSFSLPPTHGMDPDPSTYDFTVHIEGQPPRTYFGVPVIAGQIIQLRDYVASTPPAQVSNLQAQMAGLMATVDNDPTTSFRTQQDGRFPGAMATVDANPLSTFRVQQDARFPTRMAAIDADAASTFRTQQDARQAAAATKKLDVVAKSGYKSGWYISPAGAMSTSVPGEGVTNYTPLLIPRAGFLDRLAVEVTSAGTAGALIRLGLYLPDADGMPGALLLDAGTVLGTGVAVVEATINQAVSLGLLWAAATVQGGAGTRPTMRSCGASPHQFVVPTNAGVTNGYNGYTQSGISGALPATAAVSGTSGTAIRVAARFV